MSLDPSLLPPAYGHRFVLEAALLVVVAAFVGCTSTNDPASGDPHQDLAHADPKVRIGAARQAVNEDRIDLCQELVANLEDRDGAVRLFTAVALRKLTGQSFDYKPYGTDAERRAAVARWQIWLASRHQPKPGPSENPLPQPPAEAPAEPSADRNSPAMVDSVSTGTAVTPPSSRIPAN